MFHHGLTKIQIGLLDWLVYWRTTNKIPEIFTFKIDKYGDIDIGQIRTRWNTILDDIQVLAEKKMVDILTLEDGTTAYRLTELGIESGGWTFGHF